MKFDFENISDLSCAINQRHTMDRTEMTRFLGKTQSDLCSNLMKLVLDSLNTEIRETLRHMSVIVEKNNKEHHIYTEMFNPMWNIGDSLEDSCDLKVVLDPSFAEVSKKMDQLLTKIDKLTHVIETQASAINTKDRFITTLVHQMGELQAELQA